MMLSIFSYACLPFVYLLWGTVYLLCLQCGRHRFDPLAGKTLWRRKWPPTPVLLPGKSHRRRSLVGYSPRHRKESDMTEGLHFHFEEKSIQALCPFFIRLLNFLLCFVWNFDSRLPLPKVTSPLGNTSPDTHSGNIGMRLLTETNTSLGMTASAHKCWFSESVWPDYGTWISLNGNGTATYIMLQEREGCGPQSQAQNSIHIFKRLT